MQLGLAVNVTRDFLFGTVCLPLLLTLSGLPHCSNICPDNNMTKSQLIYNWLSGVDGVPTHQPEPLGKDLDRLFQADLTRSQMHSEGTMKS
jgi:hypothetical protein